MYVVKMRQHSCAGHARDPQVSERTFASFKPMAEIGFVNPKMEQKYPKN